MFFIFVLKSLNDNDVIFTTKMWVNTVSRSFLLVSLACTQADKPRKLQLLCISTVGVFYCCLTAHRCSHRTPLRTLQSEVRNASVKITFKSPDAEAVTAKRMFDLRPQVRNSFPFAY